MNDNGFVIPEDKIREQGTTDGVTHFATGVAVMRDGKVLVVRRVADDWPGGQYELPGGGVDDGEAFAHCVVREVQEETGLTVTRIVGMVDGFDYQTARKPKARQLNVIVEVAPGDVVLDPKEHDAFLWVGSDEVDGLYASDEIKASLHTVLGR
jgi:8-oxo-dGTP diphosphatase